MFKSIVSQLSLSPTIAQNLSFYAKRLKQESVTRTFSVIAAILLIGLQFSVITAPPTASNAASPNDIIYGGISSKQDLLNRYDTTEQLRSLYTYFGISRSDLASSVASQINSRDHSLSSLGRQSEGIGYQQLNIDGATYWAHHLYQFDTGNNINTGSYYNVLQGRSSANGTFFAVMFACGNLVFQSIPTPPAPPPPPPPPPPPATPVVTHSIACVYLIASTTNGTNPLTVSFRGSGMAQNTTVVNYLYNFGDGESSSNGLATTVTHVYNKPGTFQATLQLMTNTGTLSPVIAPCTVTIKTVAPPAFTSTKSAFNVTQNIDGTKRPANASDVIKYTLSTTNTGGSPAAYIFSDDFSSILQYADISNQDGATVVNNPTTGTTLLKWSPATINPGQYVKHTVTIKVKNPIPSTPISTSDPKSFNLSMYNYYGNDVVVKVTPPPAKVIETASTQLPATGSGTTFIIVLLFAALVLYFYARNRQLVREVKILSNEYHGGKVI